MDMSKSKDYFEEYLKEYPDAPSLVLVRSVELKNFPYKYLEPPILDLCCGDGFFAEQLGLSDIYGCDIDEKSIAIAKTRKIYKEVCKCDARSLEAYPDNFFTTIISNCALEHIDGIESVLKACHRVLNKKGKLIMTVPSSNLNRWFPGSKEKLVKYNARQRHLNIYSIDEWSNLLNHIRFQIVEYYYIFDEKSYKVAIFLDSLPEILSKLYAIYHYTLRITPKIVKKFLWRKLLKKYYLQSKPIRNNSSGELVIVAIKNER
jgi:ubiquinone/menaquinone biosynthesis C-methylase UbiE